ncbi:YopX family protein [Streptococcus thermophilus]
MVGVDIINLEDGKLDFIGDGITYFRKAKDIELMQSTGLTDKNGKEIFEGDVVTDGQTVGDIKHHQTYGFYMIDDKGIERWFSDGNCIEDFEEDAETVSEILEIIGNIYENPELLEVMK